MQRLIKHIFSDKRCLLAFGIAAAFCIGLAYALTRLYSFRSSMLDIGSYMQVLHNIETRGQMLSTLTLLQSEQPWLGFHFTPLLYALAPFTKWIPAHWLLNALGAAAISLAAIPIYLSACALGVASSAACLIALAYLFNPFTLNAAIWGFQETHLATLWMAITLWAVITHRFRWLLAGACLLLLTKEHYGASVAALGICWWQRHKDRRGLLLAGAGGTALTFIVGIAMPYLRHDSAHPLMDPLSDFDRFGWIFAPSQWAEIVPVILKQDLKYVTLLFASLGFLPVGGICWLLAGISDLGVNMLSLADNMARTPLSYYSVALMPVLAVAASDGYLRMQKITLSKAPYAVPVALAALLYLYYSILPLPLANDSLEMPGEPQMALTDDDAAAIAHIRALLPRDANIAASDPVGAFFTAHDKLYIFPNPATPPEKFDYVVLRLDIACVKHPCIIAPYGALPLLAETKKLLTNPSWKIVLWQKPWLVLSQTGNEMNGARKEVIETYNRVFTSQLELHSQFDQAIRQYYQ